MPVCCRGRSVKGQTAFLHVRTVSVFAHDIYLVYIYGFIISTKNSQVATCEWHRNAASPMTPTISTNIDIYT